MNKVRQVNKHFWGETVIGMTQKASCLWSYLRQTQKYDFKNHEKKKAIKAECNRMNHKRFFNIHYSLLFLLILLVEKQGVSGMFNILCDIAISVTLVL